MSFFFFKQKTAYEMRISDWSSDVCSSDLPFVLDQAQQQVQFQSLRVLRGKATGLGQHLTANQPVPRHQRRHRLQQIKVDSRTEYVGEAAIGLEIGRASWRERAWQYV